MCYHVVFCPDCQHTWLSRTKKTERACQRCGNTFPAPNGEYDTTESRAKAREVRTKLEAELRGADTTVGEWIAQSTITTDGGLTDTQTVPQQNGRFNRSKHALKTVKDAIQALENPSSDRIIEYAISEGVKRTVAQEALDELSDRGTVAHRNGTYHVV